MCGAFTWRLVLAILLLHHADVILHESSCGWRADEPDYITASAAAAFAVVAWGTWRRLAAPRRSWWLAGRWWRLRVTAASMLVVGVYTWSELVIRGIDPPSKHPNICDYLRSHTHLELALAVAGVAGAASFAFATVRRQRLRRTNRSVSG